MWRCNHVTISYPFYIINQQNSYCGYPGFAVYCPSSSSTPYLTISGGSYVIEHIWYENQTFEVVNSAFLLPQREANCSDSIQSLTLRSGSLEFATEHTKVILMLKCPKTVQEQPGVNPVNCGGIGVKEDEVGNLNGKCGRWVSAFYETDKNNNFTSLRDALAGGVLRWVAGNCRACISSGGQCGYHQTESMFLCHCSDRPHSDQCYSSGGRSKWITIGSVTAASALATGLLILLVICSLRTRANSKFTFLWTGGKIEKENHNVEAFLKSYGSLAPKRYTYTDIKKMTNSFKNRLGQGGYGHVYRGKLIDGRCVAVKMLKKLKSNGEEFINEVLSISRTNHVNVVTLLGFCFERKKRALVYEFMPNGSLEKFMHATGSGQPLPCETLFSIVVGIAKGLDYLHRGCNTRILHFDIKPHNILLDERFSPKISDFGLARLFPKEQSHISTVGARGTIGYIAPEVFCRNFGGVSHKSDVYSFGMMVIDMVCGRKNTSAEVQQSSDLYFPQWIYSQVEVEEEAALQGNANDEENKLQRKMILVSLWCIQTYPSNRPSMSTAVEMLEGSLESLQMPPKPDLSSPPRLILDSSSTSQSTM